MKKIITLLLVLLIPCLVSCSNSDSSFDPNPSITVETSEESKILIAYFSEANGQYEGVIEKGNTAYVAEYIEQYTNGDMFHIERVDPYPTEYRALTAVAQEEKNQNARPEIIGIVDNYDEYDYIFIGYPIWWGSLPMCVNTFIETYENFNGKTVIPFSTHAGSGWGSSISELRKEAPNATVLNGFSCTGRSVMNGSESVKNDVNAWLKGLGF